MRSVYSWLDEYGASHQHGFNKFLHSICVPAIVFSLMGLAWGLAVPETLQFLSPVFNWAAVLALAALVFYIFLSVRLALGMAVVLAIMLVMVFLIDRLPVPLWRISIIIFILAWIGQFIGHLAEGRRPSFFKDLQFLLIGPLWLLAIIYRKLGIAY